MLSSKWTSSSHISFFSRNQRVIEIYISSNFESRGHQRHRLKLSQSPSRLKLAPFCSQILQRKISPQMAGLPPHWLGESPAHPSFKVHSPQSSLLLLAVKLKLGPLPSPTQNRAGKGSFFRVFKWTRPLWLNHFISKLLWTKSLWVLSIVYFPISGRL